MAESAEAKELRLVGNVEWKLSLANDEKLEGLLRTYLVPVLLKLASDSVQVRNKVIGICQHINTRIKPLALRLPVEPLLKQYRDCSSQLVRHFDLIYIQIGIERIPARERVDLLPDLTEGVSRNGGLQSNNESLIFNLVLRLLPSFKLPQKGSKEDAELRVKFHLTEEDALYLSTWFGRFLLFSPALGASPGLTSDEVEFLKRDDGAWVPGSGGLSLVDTKVAVAKFVGCGAFSDAERFLPALVASSDSNSRISDVGDDILKRFDPDLENSNVVGRLFGVLFGERGAGPPRPTLRLKLLGLLSKSKKATTYPRRIVQLLDDGLVAAESLAGLEASKLRGQIFSFVTWVSRMGTTSDLSAIAPTAMDKLSDYIESQGWPTPSQRLSAPEIDLRARAYESIGRLTPRLDAPPDITLIRWLFRSLASDASDSQIFVSIDEALGALLNVYADTMSEDLRVDLRTLLLHHMNAKVGEEDLDTGYTNIRSTTFAAVRFANRCLSFSDVAARWIDIMATGSPLQEVADTGKKGLDPYWYSMLNPSTSVSSSFIDQESVAFLPDFGELVAYIFSNGRLLENGKISDTRVGSFAGSVAFARNILVANALSKSNVRLPVNADWEVKVDALVRNDEDARSAIRTHLTAIQPEPVLSFLKAAFKGFDRGLGRCGEHFVELIGLASDHLLCELLQYAPTAKDLALSNNLVTQELGAHALGILLSHPQYPKADREQQLQVLLVKTRGWKDAVGQELNQSRGALLALGYAVSRTALRNASSLVYEEPSVSDFVNAVLDILSNSRDAALKDAVQIVISQLSLTQLPPTSPLLSEDVSLEVVAQLKKEATKERDGAILALGRYAMGFLTTDEQSSRHKEILDCLYGLHEIRAPEVQFAVGEALSVATVGWASKSLLEFDIDCDQPDQGFGSVSSLPSQPILGDVLDKVIKDCNNTKPSLRKASAIWLLCLIQYCGRFKEVVDRLREAQRAFGNLLGDRDEVVQETGSRGLGIVYEVGDKDLKDALVHDLLRTFTDNTTKVNAGTVTEDTELFAEGALPTGDGGSVKTYKDIMSLAADMQDPELVYQFMSLAANNSLWSSRAAFGRFGLSNVLADSSYLTDNPKLYQKLFRYRFDPNPGVQRAMNDIWNALVKDSNAVITKYFDPIIEDLLKSILGKEWRVRQASCAAIADLVQGREIEQYEKHLDEIWTVSFKVLDDIKETVRVAAMALCQVLTNLLIRSLETGDGSSKRSQTMLNHVLPFLLSHLESSAEEVQKYATVTLIQIIKKSPAKSLREFVPQILETLISSLSSLEPQAINYVHLNADKYGLTGQDIDKMRLSSMRSSPMMEAVERSLESLDEATMGPAMSKLEGVIKSAVGLPSKVGCSRVVVSLCTRYNVLFRPYADRFAMLLRKHTLDRNDTVSASYSTALGYLMRLATDKQIVQTTEYAKKLYFTSEDTAHRAVAGEIVQAMSKVANDRFMACASDILPFAFVAKHDSEDEVKESFSKTWSENVGGSRAISLYLREILETSKPHLNSPRWVVKHTSALAVADVITSFGADFEHSQAQAVWPVLQTALAGKTWKGKEVVLEALVKFAGRAKSLAVSDQIKAIAVREAKRTNVEYRPHAVAALGALAEARDDVDLESETLSIVTPIIEELSQEQDEDKMDVDGGDGASASSERERTMAAAVASLFQCYRPRATDAAKIDPHVASILSVAGKAQHTAVHSKSIQSALYDGLKTLYEKVAKQYSLTPDDQQESIESAVSTGLAHTLTASAITIVLVGPIEEVRAQAEATRLKRADAILALSATLSTLRRGAPQVLGLVESWLGHERSRPVQQKLHSTIANLKNLPPLP